MQALTPIQSHVVGVEPQIEQQLSEEARQLLLDAARDPRGRVHYLRLEITVLQTNQKDFLTDQCPRTLATWKAALDQLEGFGLVEPQGYKREVFAMTRRGYEVADRISSRG
jgi:hypothetical protein